MGQMAAGRDAFDTAAPSRAPNPPHEEGNKHPSGNPRLLPPPNPPKGNMDVPALEALLQEKGREQARRGRGAPVVFPGQRRGKGRGARF
jgi:hypothetical protein